MQNQKKLTSFFPTFLLLLLEFFFFQVSTETVSLELYKKAM